MRAADEVIVAEQFPSRPLVQPDCSHDSPSPIRTDPDRPPAERRRGVAGVGTEGSAVQVAKDPSGGIAGTTGQV